MSRPARETHPHPLERMERPRVLLVPATTEIEWLSKPLLERWADVASYDPSWVDGPIPAEGLSQAVAHRGLEEVDRLGWHEYIVVGDELGVPAAIQLAHARREAVRGLALGHACLSFRRSGDRAPVNGEVWAGFLQLIKVDYRAFVRANLQIWDPRRTGEAEPQDADELVGRWVQRVPAATAAVLAERFVAEVEAAGGWEDMLRGLQVPLLFAEHEGCIGFNADGFADAVAAFPDAQVVRCPVSPGASPDFAASLRAFCDTIRQAAAG